MTDTFYYNLKSGTAFTVSANDGVAPVAAGLLQISASPFAYGETSPTYGFIPGLSAGDSVPV